MICAINTITTDVLNPVVPANPDVICIWPDGVWCYTFELSDFNHKSDDYTRVNINPDYDMEAIEAYVHSYVNESTYPNGLMF